MGLTIKLEWQTPLQLTKGGKLLGEPEELSARVDSKPGVYVFSRKHGKSLSPFYIGKAASISQRLSQHLKTNVRLMRVVEGYGSEVEHIGHGDRYFQFAYLMRRQNQDVEECLGIVEKALIRKAVAEDYLILNSHFTKIDKHTIISDGPKPHRAIFAKTSSVES